jgi:hypothetical protein
VWSVIQTYGKEIIALVVPAIAWVLNTFFRPRVRLKLSIPHVFTFLVQQPLIGPNGNVINPTQTVHTRSHLIFNEGREIATNVEIVFNWKPLAINVWPTRHFEILTEPDGRHILKFDSLAPGENVGCEALSLNSDLPALITVRADQGQAKSVEMYPQPVVPIWAMRLRIFLTLAGLASVVYWGIVIVQWLVLKTPVIGGSGS